MKPNMIIFDSMKRTLIYIMACAVSITAAISCIKETGMNEGNGSREGIMVRFAMPEIEVKSEGSIPEIFAYIPSQLQAGEVSPIGCTTQTGEGYMLYNLPEGTAEVIFSNISPETESVELKDDGNGNPMFSIKNTGAFIGNTDILYGKLTGITGASSDTYSVELKRVNSRMTNIFKLVDSDGNEITDNPVNTIDIQYRNLGKSASVLADGTMEYTAEESGYGYMVPFGSGELFSENFIPGGTGTTPVATVRVTMTDGTVKTYEKEIGQPFESNRHYTVTWRMKYLNTTGQFTIEEPTVNTNTYNPYFTEQEFFILSSSTTVGGTADDKLEITVDTYLPYEWTWSLTGGEEYFSVERTENGLTVTALSDNESQARAGVITLTTEEGFTRTVTIRQKCATAQKVVMKSQHSSRTQEMFISGENISVKGPSDSEPRIFNGSVTEQYVSIEGLSKGAEVTIEGDIISGIRTMGWSDCSYTDELGYKYNNYDSNRGYYYNYYIYPYDYSFTGCIYLEDLVIRTDQENLDLSELPSLKRVHLEQSQFKTVTFAENQPIVSFTAYDCDAVAGIDFSRIASTVQKINLYHSGNMTGAIITNCPELKYVNVNNCNMGVVNLSGCSAIEDLTIKSNKATLLNISNCSNLKTLSLESMTLNRIINDGAYAVENISTEYVTVNAFDFSNRTALKSVGPMTTKTFSVSGCSVLETLGDLNSVESADISECSGLKSAHFTFNGSVSAQSLLLDNSGLESLYISDYQNNIDFSTLGELKSLSFIDCRGTVTALDLSSNNKLETVEISSYNSDNTTLQSIILPKSITKAYIYNIPYFRGTLDLSGCTMLEEFDIYDVGNSYYNYNIDGNTYFELLDLSGCSSLKTINKDESNNSSRTARCNRLKAINLSGCTALEECYMNNCTISSFDFSDCQNLVKIDVGNNAMDVTAIDSMIGTLPDRSMNPTQGSYKVEGNTGASGHNSSVANEKGWWLMN